MYNLSKFDVVDGKPVEEQIINWTDSYFYNLMNLFNAFLSRLEIEEAADRLRLIPFHELVAEQLEGETEEIIKIAVDRINELLETELEFMDAYTK